MSSLIKQGLVDSDRSRSIDSVFLDQVFSRNPNAKHWDWPNSRERVWKKKRSGIELFVQDFQTLKPGVWLNGEVIEAYLKELASESNESVAVLSTYLCDVLKNGVERAVKSFRKALGKLDSNQLVIIPVKLPAHWALAAILPNEDVIRYYDGMGLKMRPQRIMERVLMLFKEIGFLKTGSIEYMENIPKQYNGHDCGVFTCLYGRCLIQNKPMLFSESMMPEFRREIGIYLLQIRQNLPGVNIYRDPIVPKGMLGEEVEDTEESGDDDFDDGMIENNEDDEEVCDLQTSMQDLQLTRRESNNKPNDVEVGARITDKDNNLDDSLFPVSELAGSLGNLVVSVRQNSNFKLAMKASLIEELRSQTKTPYIDTDDDGNHYTANMNGDWKRSLRMTEILEQLGDKAWDIIKADIRENPRLALSWCSNAQQIEHGVPRHPLRFSFGRRWNFLYVKKILEDMYGCKVEDKSATSRTAKKNAKRKLKRASPYKKVNN
jgi:hypothetical protein